MRASILRAILSFQARSSTRCQGASSPEMRNLTIEPATKHCQAGVGQECDHAAAFRGERRGEEGTGEVESAAAVLEPADKYLRVG